MYKKFYWYKSGVTKTMRDGLKELYQDIKKNCRIKSGDVILDIGANVNMPTILLNNGDIVPWGYPDYEYYLFSVTPYVDPCLTMSTNDTIDIVACESYSWNNVEYNESGFYTDSLTSSL